MSDEEKLRIRREAIGAWVQRTDTLQAHVSYYVDRYRDAALAAGEAAVTGEAQKRHMVRTVRPGTAARGWECVDCHQWFEGWPADNVLCPGAVTGEAP